jgi:glutamyl-tRNA synthetase
VTRLAPSPTGALHLGNARTFLVNWAMARREGWRIVLRIEDLDTPRVKPGVLDLTVDLLSWLGLNWDEGPIVQSADLEPYVDAMRRLVARGLAYPAISTRRELLAECAGPDGASAPQEGAAEAPFPASMRPSELPREFKWAPSDTQTPADQDRPAWRFVCPEREVQFLDRFCGPQRHVPARTVGDFIVWTKRSQPAYQLAVVVDDHRQGVTDIVRGDDLLDSAARQALLYDALGLGPAPSQCHLPLVRGEDGRRLAKRHGDTRLDVYRARGVRPERVVGLVARWCGLTGDTRREMHTTEFLHAFRLDRMSKSPVVFTLEDDAWLRAQV